MKKILSIILASALLLVGCSEATTEESSEVEATKPKKAERISSSVIDENIIGEWSNGSNGYIFGEDRKVSLFVRFSDMDIYFTKDGKFSKGGDILGDDCIEKNGSSIKVTLDESNLEEGRIDIYTLVDMTRKDGKDIGDDLDGIYTLNGCLLLQYLAEITGMDYEEIAFNDDFDFEAVVDGETLTVTFGNYCNYETIGNSLELFSKYMNYVDEDATCVKYEYTVDGNQLTLVYGTGEEAVTEIYTKVN